MVSDENKHIIYTTFTAMAFCCVISSSIQAKQIKTNDDVIDKIIISVQPQERFETSELSSINKFNASEYVVSVTDISSMCNNDVQLTEHLNIQNNADWRGVTMNSNERKVIEALANPKWDFRTVAGIAREIGFDSSSVKDILAKFPQLIRHCDIPDKNGQLLYTLSSRPKKLKENLALFRFFITKSLG